MLAEGQPAEAPVFPLAALPSAAVTTSTTAFLLAANPHQGVRTSGTEGYRRLLAGNLLNALGNPECLYDSGRRSRSTGKERDAESGLDNFLARYFSSAQGRFTSPDEPLNDQNPADPQSWNLYGYVRNNPLINADPSGQDCIYTGGYSSNGTVAVSNEQGSCSGSGGTYVAGTVDISSVNVNANNGTLNYGYTPYDPSGNYTFSNLQLPAPIEFPGIEGPANQAGAAQIAGSQSVINQFVKLAALDAVGGIVGAGVGGLLAARAAGAAAAGAETVQFGRTANQVYHALRHLQEAGVDVEAAKGAILSDIAGKGALPSGLTTGTVNVGGRSLTYNAFRLADGTINVGRITIK
jgi:RHS repeat-associated protein